MVNNKRILIVCTTDSMIWNFLVPHINYLNGKGYIVECACSRTGFFFEELVDKGYVLHEIPFERSPLRLRNICAFFMLRRLIRQGNFDIIHCHEPVGGAMGRLTGWLCGKYVMYFAHGFHFFKGAPRKTILYYIIEKYLSYLTDVLITINQEDYEAARKFHAKRNYLIHGIGIDTTKFIKKVDRNYLKYKFDLVLENIYLLSVGELIHRKNHITVIHSLVTLPSSVHYLIVGEGALESELVRETRKLGLEERVHFLGFRKDIDRICNAVDIFIFPSLQEGLSVALMEAMASGLPIIASNIRGNNDLVDDCKGGYLVKSTDPTEYSSRISDLIDAPDLMSTFGEYNLKKVKLFDTKMVLNEIGEIIDNI